MIQPHTEQGRYILFHEDDWPKEARHIYWTGFICGAALMLSIVVIGWWAFK